MPYIEPVARKELDPLIDALFARLNCQGLNMGNLNYTITRLVVKTFLLRGGYDTIAGVTGVLENVKQEFYRRAAVPYEFKKMVANGDIREYEVVE